MNTTSMFWYSQAANKLDTLPHSACHGPNSWSASDVLVELYALRPKFAVTAQHSCSAFTVLPCVAKIFSFSISEQLHLLGVTKQPLYSCTSA